jgi:pyochelin synthetase
VNTLPTQNSAPAAQAVSALLAQLQKLDVQLWVHAKQLHYRAPPGALSEELKARIRAIRPQLVAWLEGGEHEAVQADPEAALEPFPLTQIQAAYCVGRSPALAWGGLPCMAYVQLSFGVGALAVPALNRALARTITNHAALRTQVVEQSFQQVLACAPQVLRVTHHAVGDAAGFEQNLQQMRQTLLAAQLDRSVGQWPPFSLTLTDGPTEQVLHLAIDLVVMDFASVELWLRELVREAMNPSPDTLFEPSTALSFRDLVLVRQKARDGASFVRAQEHWLNRIEQLPSAPQLPLRSGADAFAPVGLKSFARMTHEFDSTTHAALVQCARHAGLTPSSVYLGAFAETLARWSRSAQFTLTITSMQRPTGARTASVLGDFTSTLLLGADMAVGETFRARLQALQERLLQDLEHAVFSGVDVQRLLTQRKGRNGADMPVVFTSTMGALDTPTQVPWRLRGGITWTPQVWLDCQVLTTAGQVYLNWDYRTDVFEPTMVQAMFDSYVGLLRRLSHDASAWNERFPTHSAAPVLSPLPSPFEGQLLHCGFLNALTRWPTRLALSDAQQSLTYEQLGQHAHQWAQALATYPRASLVAVAMDKGAEQVVAVLAVLMAGHAYVPLDVGQPLARKAAILADAGVVCLLTQPALATQECYDGVPTLVIDLASSCQTSGVRKTAQHSIERACADPGQTAYLIYTSGTTGAPKGVVMSHRASANTVADINERIGLKAQDVVLGLSGLGFDLSVYDIFGTLAVGAHLVLPHPAQRADPGHWAELLAQHGVTVWNSVPAQAEMLVQQLRSGSSARTAAALESMRVLLLSGDTIAMGLAPTLWQLKAGLRIIALGGATEAAIWSIWHPIEAADIAHATSIPYGVALTGQSVHVFDSRGCECPVGVTGEIHISGSGLAKGYHRDLVRTQECFYMHAQMGFRCYRTGDLGRYLPDGKIEFLGREDQQVKIRGHRVELGEIAYVLERHSSIASAAVVAQTSAVQGSPKLHAFVTSARADPTVHAQQVHAAQAMAQALSAHSQVLAAQVAPELLDWSKQLHQLVLVSLRSTLAQHGHTGAHDLQTLMQSLSIAPKFERLMHRCLCALECAGLRWEGPDEAHTAQALAAAWQGLADTCQAVGYPTELLAYFRHSSTHLLAQLQGRVEPTSLFFPEGSAELAWATFADNPTARLCNELAAQALRHLAQAREPHQPALRVLELGGGVGAVTSAALRALADQRVDYLFTDVSPYFVQQMAHKYPGHPQLRLATLNIHQLDALGEPAFDVLVCADLLHALPNVPAALAALSGQVVPGAWLVLLEATTEHAAALVSLELMLESASKAGGFLDERGTHGSTFASTQQWHSWLAQAGWCAQEPWPQGPLAQVGLQIIMAQYRPELVSFDKPALQAHLREHLPSHMLPHSIELLASLPLTPNGKLNRKALLERCENSPELPAPAEQSTTLGASATERAMLALWQDALGRTVPCVQTGFFDLDGDSLVAARLAARIVEAASSSTQVRYFDEVLRWLMQGCSVAQMLAHLVCETAAPMPTLVQPSVDANQANAIEWREGLAGSEHLFLVITHSEDKTDAVTWLRTLAEDLVLMGAVALIQVPAASQDDWAQHVFSELSSHTLLAQRQWVLVSAGRAVWPGMALLRQGLWAGTGRQLRCLVLTPQEPPDELPTPLIADTLVLSLSTADADTTAGVQGVQDVCLGAYNHRSVAAWSHATDFVLDWVQDHTLEASS